MKRRQQNRGSGDADVRWNAGRDGGVSRWRRGEDSDPWQQAKWIDAMSRIDLELLDGDFPDQDLQAAWAADKAAPESREKAPGRRVGLWLAAVSGIAATSIAITTVAVMAGRRRRQPA